MSHNNSDKWRMMKRLSFENIHNNKAVKIHPAIYVSNDPNKIITKKELKNTIDNNKLWTDWKDGIDYNQSVGSMEFNKEDRFYGQRITEGLLRNDLESRDDNELLPYYIMKTPLSLLGVLRRADCYEFIFYNPSYTDKLGSNGNRGIHTSRFIEKNQELLNDVLYYNHERSDYIFYVSKYKSDRQVEVIDQSVISLLKSNHPYSDEDHTKRRDNWIDGNGYFHKLVYCRKGGTIQYSLDSTNYRPIYALNLIDGNDSKLIIENYKIPPPPTNENPDDGDDSDDDDYDNSPPDWINEPGPHPGWGPGPSKPKPKPAEPAKPKSPDYYIDQDSLRLIHDVHMVLFLDTTEFKHEPNVNYGNEYTLDNKYGSSEFHFVEGIYNNDDEEKLGWWYGIHDKFYHKDRWNPFVNSDYDDYYLPILVIKPSRTKGVYNGKTYDFNKVALDGVSGTKDNFDFQSSDKWLSGDIEEYPFNYDRLGCYNGSRRYKVWVVDISIKKSFTDHEKLLHPYWRRTLPYTTSYIHYNTRFSNLFEFDSYTTTDSSNEDPSFSTGFYNVLRKSLKTSTGIRYIDVTEPPYYEYGLSNKLVIKLPRTTVSNKPQLITYLKVNKYLKVFFDKGYVKIYNVHGNQWFL